jgi:hypothetical protein
MCVLDIAQLKYCADSHKLIIETVGVCRDVERMLFGQTVKKYLGDAAFLNFLK